MKNRNILNNFLVRDRKMLYMVLSILLVLVLTLTVVYASLSTTLNINGTAQVQDASWNVHFDNVQVNPYSVDINPVITDNNKITFSADLTTPGDFYKFTVDIVNSGSIDAMIESIAKVPELTTEQKKYLRYEVEYVDGNSINDSQLLKSGETKTISVLFSYRNDIPVSDLPNTETDFDLEIVLVYVQANNTGVEISGQEKLVKVVSGDLNTVGSEICIGEECFYLISNDGASITMFAKYNLYAGGEYDGNGLKEYGDEATGLQDPTMIGYQADNFFPRYGVLQFSSTDYWESYVSTYPAYVYNEQSLLFPYIENYKKYLEKKGSKILNSRLISIEELIDLGCDKYNRSCINSSYDWIYSTSYWTGSVTSSIYVWFVNFCGGFTGSEYDIFRFYGVRPVVEISLTEF